MTSPFAGLALLCVCLSLTVPVSGSRLKLVKLTQEFLQNTKAYRLTADFEADSRPEAQWWLYGHYDVLDPPSGSILTYGHDPTNPMKGSATLTLSKDDAVKGVLFLSLGDLDSHFFELEWNLGGTDDLNVQLDLPLSTVSPGTDLAYNSGKAIYLTIAVKEHRGETDFGPYFNVYLSGDVIYDRVWFFRYMGRPVFEESDESKNGVTTTSVKFLTDRYPISGIFSGKLYGILNHANAPVTRLIEHFTVKVHAASTAGPFPDNAVVARHEDPTICSRDVSYQCYLGCTGFGNDLDSVKIYQEDQYGWRKLLPAKVSERVQVAFRRTVKVKVDTGPLPDKSKFVCEATLKGGGRVEDRFILSIEN
uniref:Uncharacterized protein n=1 Tax=Conus geographus TaxID=6491 RepID=W4VS00_CONGE